MILDSGYSVKFEDGEAGGDDGSSSKRGQTFVADTSLKSWLESPEAGVASWRA
jgi:hypothetical protein